MKAVKFILAVLFKMLYRVEIIGMEHVPEKGAALLCANHNGILDMFFIGYKLKRTIHYMAKQELFRNPLLGAAFRYLGAFPVKRGSGDIKAVKTTLDLLEHGHIVGIFPEGTRTRGKSPEEVKIKPGLALFAIKSGAPVVPVAVQGSYRPFSHVKVIFGQPFILDADRNRKYTVKEMTVFSQDIMDRIYSLMEAT